MSLFGWVFLSGGLFGLIATRLGWYDVGGPMRRMDWFDLYGSLERPSIGGGVRRANYTISAAFVVIGLIIIARAA
jgi:hypothetical protein